MDYIIEMEDFLSPQAKNLAQHYIKDSRNFPIIPYDFIEIVDRIINNQKEITVDLADPSTPHNFLDDYIKKVASTELVYWEFTKRDLVVFLPKNYIYGTSETTNKDRKTLIRNDILWIPIERPGTAEGCKSIAKYYQYIREQLHEWDYFLRELSLEGELEGEFKFKIT